MKVNFLILVSIFLGGDGYGRWECWEWWWRDGHCSQLIKLEKLWLNFFPVFFIRYSLYMWSCSCGKCWLKNTQSLCFVAPFSLFFPFLYSFTIFPEIWKATLFLSVIFSYRKASQWYFMKVRGSYHWISKAEINRVTWYSSHLFLFCIFMSDFFVHLCRDLRL